MAKVNLTRCDRCGRVENAHYVSSVGRGADDGPITDHRTDDLCDVCFELLLKFLDGAKLARTRAPK